MFKLNQVTVDGLGRLRDANETITNHQQTQIPHSYTNQYDMRSQLTYSKMTNISGLAWVSDTYSYDKAGNVQSHICANSVPSTVATPYTFDGDLMTQAGSTAVNWDWNGNLVKKDEATTADTNLVYNWDNKLRTATKGTQGIGLKYDPLGNRAWRQSLVSGNPTATRKYVVDISGGLPTILLELDPCTSMQIKKTYIYGNSQILAQHDGTYAASRYFYLHDRLGSVRQVISTDGLVRDYYTYDPFGKIAGTYVDPVSNPFKFTGQWYDSQIGWYYLRERMYDPVLMRFTGRDPVRGRFNKPLTLHTYLYCLNEPVNHIDPNGQLGMSLASSILTGAALLAHATDFACYGVVSENESFWGLAAMTIEFTPYGMSLAYMIPFSVRYVVEGVVLTTEYELLTRATGMGYLEGAAMDPVVFILYATTLMYKEHQGGSFFDDEMEEFRRWHGPL